MIITGYFGVNLGGSGEISGPLLEKNFGLWPTFEMGLGDFWSSRTDEIAFWPTFCGFVPTFKNETGPEKTQCLCGFAGSKNNFTTKLLQISRKICLDVQ